MEKESTTQEKAFLKLPSIQELFDASVHLGHKTSRWHPKMKPYIFGAKHGVHFFNLEKTLKQLEDALIFLRNVLSRGGLILFVGTKPAAKNIVKEIAQALNMPYVFERWLGGTLTNFKTINKRLKYLLELEKQQAEGAWDNFTKKERLMQERKMQKLQKQLVGLRNLSKIPEAIFIADIKKDELSLKEAKLVKSKVVAICDSNVDPSDVDYPICGNDDATTSIRIILETLKNNLADVKVSLPIEEDKKL